MELRALGDVKIVLKNKPSQSDSSIESSWSMIDGRRWANTKVQSGPGIDTMNRLQDESLKRTHHDATMAEERKKEQDTDLQNTPPPHRWRHNRSPTSCGTPGSSWAGVQVIEEEKEVDVDDQGAARGGPLQATDRAIITPGVIVAHTPLFERRTTPTPTPIIIAECPAGEKCSMSAAMDQGLKGIPSGNTAAASHRIEVGDCLDREIESPTWLVSVGALQTAVRGEGNGCIVNR